MNRRQPPAQPVDDTQSASRRIATRRESRKGWLGDLRFDRRPLVAAAPAGRRWIVAGLAAVALLVALAFWLRQPLADRIWPDARAQKLRTQAALALAQGRLTAGDGTGARELYEAAIAIDPDRSDALTGLMRVGATALSQAETALAQGRFAEAHRALALARELSVPRARADGVAARLRQREAAHAGIDVLLARAARARAAARLDDAPDAALPLYRRILSLQPQRIEALEGREDAIADMLQRARADLAAGRLAEGAAGIAAARGYDAGHMDLPDAEAGLTRARERARQRADGQLRRGRLQQASDAYRALLVIDAQDAAAARGLTAAAAAYARDAERLASDFDFAAAQAALGQARALAPQSPAIAAAEGHLDRARQSRARLQRVAVGKGGPRRAQALLREAAAAEARGDLLTPPGDSAFDKLRAARALAPDDAAVRRASARMLSAARQCFERQLQANDLGRARACLDAASALGDGSATLRQSRRRLAERWLAVGDERLGAGELSRAVAALAAARDIDRSAPGLDAFQERLRTASASGD